MITNIKKWVLLVSVVLTLVLVFSNQASTYNDDKQAQYDIHLEKVLRDDTYGHARDGFQSFTFDQDIALKVAGEKLSGPIKVDVYKSDMGELLNNLIYTNEYKQVHPKIPLTATKKVASLNVQAEDRFALPVEGNGVWIVRAYTAQGGISMFVTRSKYGAVVREEKNKLLFWVQDLQTKRSAPNVPIAIFALRDKMEARTIVNTDQHGIAHTDISAQYDVAVVGEGGEEALVPINLTSLNYDYDYHSAAFHKQTTKYTNFLFTDRPLYKPGDTVHFKMIMRADDDLHYSPLSGTWQAELSYGWGDDKTVVDSGEYRADEFGTVTGDLEIPEDAKTGEYYSLSVTNEKYSADESTYYWRGGNGDGLTNIRVEHYRKPQYTLKVDIDKQEYINGEQLDFEVEGHYFSGEALSDAQIKYTVLSNNLWEPLYVDSLSDDFRAYQYGYAYGDEVAAGTTVLDAQGQAHISVPTKITDQKSKVYTVRVEYAASTDEPVIDQENTLVYAGEYGIFRQDYRYAVTVGKDNSIIWQLHKRQDQAKVDAQTLDFTGKYVWWEKVNPDARYPNYERREKAIAPMSATTDKRGRAVLHFRPEHIGHYELTVTATDQLGNKISKEFSLWSTDNESAFVPMDHNSGLSILLDKTKYQPTDTVTMQIFSVVPDRDVLVSLERDFVHKFYIVSLHGQKGEIKIPLSETDIPNMSLQVSSFMTGQLSQDGRQLEISAQSKKLNIQIKTDKEQYSPGDKVTVNLYAVDSKNQPQQADIALWAVDKALFELVPLDDFDVFGAFWLHRYGYTESSNSLDNIWVYGYHDGGAEGGGCFLPGTQVLMANGQTKNIEDIRVGERIMTPGQDDYKLHIARVDKLHSAVTTGYFVINDTLRVTGNHIVWVNNTWKRADRLRVGDIMRGQDNQDIEVQKIEWRQQTTPVYNLIIDKEHTYLADGYFVHNGKGDGDIRSQFKDVAFWNPHVRTGSDGKATVSFVLPDNLTAWVLSTVGTTADTIVGHSTKDIRTSKSVVIHPQLPNILRKGDKVVLSALARNNTKTDRTFKAQLKIANQVLTDQDQTINIPAGKSKVIKWSVNPDYKQEKITVTFSVQDINDKTIADTVMQEIPVQEFGFWESDSIAQIGLQSIPVTVADDAINDKTSVKLLMSSSILGSLTGATEYLLHYPYGCMEQTTSAFMPAVLAKENPEFFATALQGKDIDGIIAVGVKRLSDKQNSDGGWGWWGGDSDTFLSAYITEYLLRAQAVGAKVDTQVLNKAKGYFFRDIKTMGDEKIMMAYGHSLFAGKGRPLIKVTNQDTPDVVAMAVIANVRNGHTDQAVNGYQVLWSQMQKRGNGAYWPAGQKKYFGSIDASTGIALRALTVSGADQQTITPILNYLSTNRRHSYWSNTFATAQILEGVVRFAKLEKQTPQKYSISVLLDGKTLTTKTFNTQQTAATVSLPTDKLRGAHTLSFISNPDNAQPYITLLTKEYHTDSAASPVSRTISLRRSYQNADYNKTGLSIGDTVIVNLEVSGLKDGDRYLLIEDQLPAGLSPLNEHLDNVNSERDNQWANKEYTENGVLINKPYIDGGSTKTYSYKARVVSEGEYSVPPARALLMYSPEIYAHSGSQQIHIGEGEIISEQPSQSSSPSKQPWIWLVLITLSLVAVLVFWLASLFKHHEPVE